MRHDKSCVQTVQMLCCEHYWVALGGANVAFVWEHNLEVPQTCWEALELLAQGVALQQLSTHSRLFPHSQVGLSPACSVWNPAGLMHSWSPFQSQCLLL
jgi:hypothetical protein